MLSRIQSDGLSYRGFATSDELGTLIAGPRGNVNGCCHPNIAALASRSR